MKNDPKLLSHAARGDFQMVFVAPEPVGAQSPSFRSLMGLRKTRSPFAKGLSAMIVDEAHFCYTWYASVSLLSFILEPQLMIV